MVEILRCAADLVGRTPEVLSRVTKWLGLSRSQVVRLCGLYNQAMLGGPLIMLNEERRWRLLEAAQRVEEGLWP